MEDNWKTNYFLNRYSPVILSVHWSVTKEQLNSFGERWNRWPACLLLDVVSLLSHDADQKTDTFEEAKNLPMKENVLSCRLILSVIFIPNSSLTFYQCNHYNNWNESYKELQKKSHCLILKKVVGKTEFLTLVFIDLKVKVKEMKLERWMTLNFSLKLF